MKFVKLYTGEDQKSYFMDIDSGSVVKKELGFYSEKFPATGMFFRNSMPGATFEWHNAPQPQYIIYLEGQVEVEASGGEKRIFHAGDVLFAADITGKGHISRVLTAGKAIVVTTK